MELVTPIIQSKPVETWDQEIEALETFFAGATIPDGSIELNPWSTIVDVQLFIESHLVMVKNYNGIRTFEPYLTRLKEIRNILKGLDTGL